MAVSFIGAGALADATWPNTAGSQNTSAPFHASTTTGDFLLLVCVHRGDVASLTGPGGGWAEAFNGEGITPQVNDGGRIGLFWKFHDGSEAEPTWTWGAGAGPRNGVILTYRDVDTTDPFDQIPASLSGNAAAQNIGPIAGFTPSSTVGAILVIGVRGDDWTSVATLTGESLTWNERVEQDTTAGNDMGMVIDDTLDWTSGAIAAKTFTVTGGAATARGAGLMFGLNNVAAGEAEEQDIDDTGSGADAISKRPGKAVADAGTGADASTRTVGKGLADTGQASDAAAKAVGHPLADTATAADATSRAVGHVQADTGTAGDDSARAVGKGLSDAATAADAVERMWAALRTITDTGQAADATSLAAGKGLAEAVQASDAQAATVGKALADLAEAADSVVRSAGVNLADAATAADELATQAGYNRTIADEGQATDELSFDHVQASDGTLDLGEQAQASDALEITWQAFRTFADTGQATDQVGKHIAITLADAAEAHDAIAKSPGVRVVDVGQGADQLGRSVHVHTADTATATDALARVAGYVRTIADLAHATDDVQLAGGGASTYGGHGPGSYGGGGAGTYDGFGPSEYPESTDQSPREATYGGID